MQSRIRNELHCTELILDSEEQFQENYQIRMIRENQIGNLLKLTSSGKDSGTQYLYDISGMKSMKRALERQVCDKDYMEQLLRILLECISQMSNYMLDINHLILDPEYIFVKEEKFYFCYYPGLKEGILESFHHLVEFFVKEIDYGDYPSVMLACGLHKETMEKDYELKSLIQKYANIQVKEDKKEVEYKVDDLENQEISELQGEGILRDSPVRRFWNHKKKDKWGTWDDLLIREESSIMDKNHI